MKHISSLYKQSSRLRLRGRGLRCPRTSRQTRGVVEKRPRVRRMSYPLLPVLFVSVRLISVFMYALSSVRSACETRVVYFCVAPFRLRHLRRRGRSQKVRLERFEEQGV